MLPLKNIIEVMDISETDECKNMFAVRYEATGNSFIDKNRKQPICFDDQQWKRVMWLCTVPELR